MNNMSPPVRHGHVSEPDIHTLLTSVSKEAGAAGVWAYNRTGTTGQSIDIYVTDKARQQALLGGLKAGGIAAALDRTSSYVVIPGESFAEITTGNAQKAIEAIKRAETPVNKSRFGFLSKRGFGGQRPNP